MSKDIREMIDKVKSFNQFVNENENKLKGEYFIDSLSGETFDSTTFNDDEYGVFFSGSKELVKEGHCYFYGSEEDAEKFAERKNQHLKERGYF